MTHIAPTQSRHLLATLFVALFGFSAASFADTHKSTTQPEGQKQARNMQQQGMIEELKLNDKQRALYKSAMKQKMDTMRGGMDKHDDLRDLTLSDGYSEAKARELARKHCAEMEANMVNSSKAMNEFYKSLSAEQKTKLKAIQKAKSAKMKDQMHDRMDDGMHERKKDKKDKKAAE